MLHPVLDEDQHLRYLRRPQLIRRQMALLRLVPV